LEVFDLGYPGLSLRIGHGGAKTFQQFYRVGGKLKRETLGRWPAITLATARDTWRRTREAVARGEAPSANGKGQLFEHVVEEWLRRDQADSRQSSQYQLHRLVEADLLPAWRGRHVTNITKRDVLTLLDGVVDRGAPAQAKKIEAYVKRFFRWCHQRDLIAANPLEAMEPLPKPKSRERILSDDEFAKVWHAADEGPHRIAIRLLVLTGARREEISQLKWCEIDGTSIVLAGERTKNGEPRIIPLSVPAMALLAANPHIGDYVFTLGGHKPIGSWGRAKRALDDAAGVTGWRIHDLRRTVATGMQKLGVTLQTVEAVLGHTSGSRDGIVGVYQRHDYAAEKISALEAWGAHVMAKVQP
jgi:integrase